MQTEKPCFKCGSVKPLSEFYRQSSMKDGHLNKCKDCAREDVKRNRDAKRTRYQAYDRFRYHANKDKRTKKQTNRIRKSLTPEERELLRDKIGARGVAYRMLRRGELIRPAICPQCMKHMDEVGKIQMHHPDYSKPGEIIWMCPKCHGNAHVKPVVGLPF